MSLDDCATALRDHDPDRFGICLLAQAEARPKLLTLYALNLELARAPLASTEPLIAEMRLQWWVERLEDIGTGTGAAAIKSHELLAPLAEAWGPQAGAFAALAEPRRRDSLREPHDGPDAVARYIRDTAVPLAQFAATALCDVALGEVALGDVAPAAQPVIAAQAAIAAQAEGAGLVHWLAALPALQGLGLGLWDPSPEALARIAADARAKLAQARALRRDVPRRLAPVLFSGAGLTPVLTAAPMGIEALAKVAPSEFRRRFALGAFALTHRWWH